GWRPGSWRTWPPVNAKGAREEASRAPRTGPCDSAQPPHLGGLQSLRALEDVELHELPLLQRLEALHLDRGEVHEDILTGLLGDEAVSLGVVEPLHSALRHV